MLLLSRWIFSTSESSISLPACSRSCVGEWTPLAPKGEFRLDVCVISICNSRQSKMRKIQLHAPFRLKVSYRNSMSFMRYANLMQMLCKSLKWKILVTFLMTYLDPKSSNFHVDLYNCSTCYFECGSFMHVFPFSASIIEDITNWNSGILR